MKNDFSIIISTCDKFSDLWEAHIQLLNQNWSDRNVETYLVTDKQTDRKFDNVHVIAAGEATEITERLLAVMPMIKTKYILFTLDDYFLTEKISTYKILNEFKVMENNNLDYVRLDCLSKKDLKNRLPVKVDREIYLIDNWARDYVVSLYAGLWKKSFMQETLRGKMNAWQYEVALTRMARELNARCAISCRKDFPILDVIRKGKVLTEARKYFDKNPIYTGTRETMKRKDEIIIDIRTWLRVWLPTPLFKFAKAIMRCRGYKFYSDEL